jgi:hypothetical protein
VAPSLERLQRRHWGLVLLVAVVAWLAGRPGAGGVALGGGAIGLSLFVYALVFRSVVGRPRPRLAIALLFVKLAALLGLAWFAFSVRQPRPDPIGFAVGVSCLPVSAVWEALSTRRR